MNRTGCLPSIPGISLKILVPGTAHNLRFARLVHNQESAADGLQSFTVAHSTSTGTRIEILSNTFAKGLLFVGIWRRTSRHRIRGGRGGCFWGSTMAC